MVLAVGRVFRQSWLAKNIGELNYSCVYIATVFACTLILFQSDLAHARGRIGSVPDCNQNPNAWGCYDDVEEPNDPSADETGEEIEGNISRSDSENDQSLKDEMDYDDSEHMVVEGEPTEFYKTLLEADELDEFFNDERFSDEVRYARAVIRLDTYYREGDGFEIKPGTKFKFALPGAERRLFFLLNGDFDRAINGDDSETEEAGIKNLLEPSEPDDASFALQAFLRATKKLNISIQVGARVRDWTPVGFIGPRYRQTFDMETWLLRITQQARWYTDEGFALRSVFDFEKRFSKKFFLRITPNASWNEEDANVLYGTKAQLFHSLGKDAFMEYQLQVRAETAPIHELESIVARVRYRRTTPWPWLFVEVAPEVAFEN
jgi:hypothetical protein